MERASPRSRLKRAWWKEAKEFEVVPLTPFFLCSVLVLLNLLLCWGWTRGDYHKGVWLQRGLHSMRVGGLVSNAKFQCLGKSWSCCDNGLKERQRRQLRRGEREKKLIFSQSTNKKTQS